MKTFLKIVKHFLDLIPFFTNWLQNKIDSKISQIEKDKIKEELINPKEKNQ